MWMRVVQVTRFGGPEVLEATELPDPVARRHDVVVDVSAAEILFLDTQLRSGWGREFFALEPPFVPGAGVAGTVSAVGEQVDPSWVGRQVVAGTGPEGTYVGGGYAERFAVPADDVHEVPAGLDPSIALAGLHDGLTALGRLLQADIRPGERVLVTAAGGSLGAWLVPLARAAGGFVIGAARGERKLKEIRALGADLALDYSETGWEERVRETTDGAGVDVVFDGAGGSLGGAAFRVTTTHGRFFAYGAAAGDFADFDPLDAERRQVRVIGIADRLPPEESAKLPEQALSALADGRIRPVIGQTFPLERAADAHAAIEAREAIGKTLLVA
jgi:NADPH:quinone reductase